MRNLFLSLAACLLYTASLMAQPVVSNVSYIQQPDGAGSTEVVVTYDLASPNGPAEVVLLYSTDGGTNFTTATTTTGDVGPGIMAGTGLMIDWAVATDLAGQQITGNFVVRVLAEDGVTIPLVISSTIAEDSVSETASQTLTFTFAEAVTGFDASDVALSGGTAGTFTPVSATVYTLDVTGAGGTVTASVVAGAASSASGTGNGTAAASFSNFYQDTWTLDLDGGTTFMELIRIPAGTFTMGSPPTELSRFSDETEHEVTISQDFYLGKTEVTQDQWAALQAFPQVQDHPGGDLPVHLVSYNDIQSWLADLDTAIIEPGSFGLPTESQWEYACRAGTTTRFNFGDGFGADENCSTEAERMDNMWYCGNNSPNGLKIVGQKPANGWGLHDMHGNAMEWTADWYDANYPAGPVTDPTGPASGTDRVARGGRWQSNAWHCRSARRDLAYQGLRDDRLGFRLLAVRPTPLTITSTETASVHQTAIQTLTFTFGTDVTDFDLTDINLFGATAGTFTEVSPSVYTLEVTGTGGTISVEVAAGAAEAPQPLTGHDAASFSNFYQDTWTLDLDGGTTFMELIRIPAGTFTMGSPVTELSRSSDEAQHDVTFSEDFYLGKTEVTQAQWLAIEGSWPGPSPSAIYGLGDDYPAYDISYGEIQTFLTNLDTAITEPGTFSLPTESQWEYACRAGTTTRFNFGDGLSTDENCATGAGREDNMWYCGNNGAFGNPDFATKIVGQKPANAWGLRDMHGNVWEWCADWYGTYPTGPVTDPTGAGTGSYRIIRGSAWGGHARHGRSAWRGYSVPTSISTSVGFRVLAVRP